MSRPRDAREFAGRPCNLLTSAQRATLGFTEDPGQTREPVPGVVSCKWQGAAAAFDLTAFGNRDLLSDTYRARVLPVFMPTEVQGLPAVIQRDAPDSITCTVTTGLAEEQALETNWYERRLTNGRPARDPCVKATQVATMVVSNLPPLR